MATRTHKKSSNEQHTTLGAQLMAEGAVRDLVTDVVRTAIREHSRELEKHLNSIHERLLTLEKR